MVEEKISVPVDLQEREYTLDWLTALSPILLIALCYYRWAAVGVVLMATAGYLTAAVLLQWAGVLACRTAPAVTAGMLAAFCLPATTPLWAAALAGAIAAPMAALPGLLARIKPGWPISRPLLYPALVGYLLVRLAFPAHTTTYTMPVQWAPLDSVSTATPLAGLGEPLAINDGVRLLLGVHAGSIGGGCVPVILLAGVYLLLRRRLRLIVPGVMLATVSLLSWMVWGAPLYGLLAGGTVLAALLVADRMVAPASYGAQAVAGVVAGGTTVLLRAAAGMDGAAVGVLLAGVLAPVYAPFLHWSGIALRKAWQYTCIGSVWFWSRALVPFTRLAWRGICVAAVWLWTRALVPFARLMGRQMGRLWALLGQKCENFAKRKNKG